MVKAEFLFFCKPFFLPNNLLRLLGILTFLGPQCIVGQEKSKAKRKAFSMP